MEFIVRQLSSRPDTMVVRYNCACGCKPNAEYKQGSPEAGHEHCCCGIVHFAGPEAKARLEEYIGGRQAQGLDDDVGGYTVHDTSVTTPWGGDLPVAYALPETLRKH